MIEEILVLAGVILSTTSTVRKEALQRGQVDTKDTKDEDKDKNKLQTSLDKFRQVLDKDKDNNKTRQTYRRLVSLGSRIGQS